jgi:hypothetical protein
MLVLVALAEQLDGGASGEAVQPALSLPAAAIGLDIKGAQIGAGFAQMRHGLALAPRLHAAVSRRRTEQPVPVGPVQAEGVLRDLDAELALAHPRGDVGFGRRLGRAGAGGVRDFVLEGLVQALEGTRQEFKHCPLLPGYGVTQ